MRHRLRSQFPQRGFTLLEIMVVVAIIAILSTVVVINLAGNVDEARVTRARQDIQALTTALQLYRNDNASYPSSQQGLDALMTRPSGNPPAPNWKPYLAKLPNDPWGRPYQYLQPGQRGEFDVWSMGADQRNGGEGQGADIGNW
ncbi:MAG: type II secretion system major pseudopilin GspG [Xanthomonadales bacterium]|nr:Type II secretion system protein G [Xanthomonadales bacterium]MCC6592445.1 type II secretion system major pseudopilin GspG [Xanthomonadales bacterium]MCE7931592.1 type II secretion system protein GspG [Xanthomonadales bacterium PRO6]